MFSAADHSEILSVMSVPSLVQLAPLAKACVNDMQVIQIMCKLQKVFQVCVSTPDRPSTACFFLFSSLGQICILDPGREARMTCCRGQIQIFSYIYIYVGVIEMFGLKTESFKKLQNLSTVTLRRSFNNDFVF